MKKILIFILIIVLNKVNAESYDKFDDGFAEFEDFEAEDEGGVESVPENVTPEKESPKSNEADDEIEIDDEDDESEFEHFQDVEEFEGFETGGKEENKPITEPKITITKVPMHFRENWDSYWLEILMVAGLLVYFINFITGKTKNQKIANSWFHTNKGLLEDNFSLVGDDGSLEKSEGVQGFNKESENVFTLWCSGRTCCEGMLVELKLIKRQDLLSILSGMMRPTLDQVHIKVFMNKEDMDSFVFCVATKKTATHFAKEMADLCVYCPERRTGDKYNIPSQYNVMSEIAEATSALLDSKLIAMLNKYTDLIDYIHFSDQYSGSKQTDDQPAVKLPDNQRILSFGFNICLKGVGLEEAMTQMRPLLTMVFYCIEKVKRYRLSKEGKTKADKNRQRVEEAYLKSTHQARAEAAAARREEKRRLEKEKVMADEDPERQRRWEEKEQKRQAKKRAPKMKQLKVKAL